MKLYRLSIQELTDLPCYTTSLRLFQMVNWHFLQNKLRKVVSIRVLVEISDNSDDLLFALSCGLAFGQRPSCTGQSRSAIDNNDVQVQIDLMRNITLENDPTSAAVPPVLASFLLLILLLFWIDTTRLGSPDPWLKSRQCWRHYSIWPRLRVSDSYHDFNYRIKKPDFFAFCKIIRISVDIHNDAIKSCRFRDDVCLLVVKWRHITLQKVR